MQLPISASGTSTVRPNWPMPCSPDACVSASSTEKRRTHNATAAPDPTGGAMSDTNPRHDSSRSIAAPTGTKLTCKSWLTEAPLRMLMNNLDPDVAEHPQELVVYGGIGRAARDWASY